MNQTTALTIGEKADLRTLTLKIDHATAAWREAVPALLQIRDRKLYREEAETFEEFCQKRWGWSRQWVNKQIQADAAIAELPENLETTVSSVNAGMALAKVPRKKRTKAVKAIVEQGQPVTAQAIQQAASAPTPPKPPPIPLDHEGWKVPAPAIPFWERRDEVQKFLTQISDIKSFIEKAREAGDSLYARVSQSAIGYLGQAYSALSDAKMYAVCTDCQGWFDKGPTPCSNCHGTGLISKYRWQSCSRKEVKDLRAVAIAKRL